MAHDCDAGDTALRLAMKLHKTACVELLLDAVQSYAARARTWDRRTAAPLGAEVARPLHA